MTSTIVYHELSQQSSSLSLKLSNPSKLIFSSSSTNSHSSYNDHSKCGWSAIEALSSSNHQKQEREAEYVHPLAKRSSYSKFMSEKSLEMCTESLGSETGAFFSESHLFCLSTTTTTAATATTNNNNNRKPRLKNLDRNNKSHEFPPPLTTMRGSNSLQVRPYREDGRLVIEAVSAPPSHSYLKVERSDGRLRMSLVREEEEDEEEEEEEAEAGVSIEGNSGTNVVDEEEGEEEEEKEEGVEGKEEGVKLEEDMNVIRVKFGGKMGKGDEFQRPITSCRCKEGGRGNIKRLINWEPFWVAT